MMTDDEFKSEKAHRLRQYVVSRTAWQFTAMMLAEVRVMTDEERTAEGLDKTANVIRDASIRNVGAAVGIALATVGFRDMRAVVNEIGHAIGETIARMSQKEKDETLSASTDWMSDWNHQYEREQTQMAAQAAAAPKH